MTTHLDPPLDPTLYAQIALPFIQVHLKYSAPSKNHNLLYLQPLAYTYVHNYPVPIVHQYLGLIFFSGGFKRLNPFYTHALNKLNKLNKYKYQIS